MGNRIADASGESSSWKHWREHFDHANEPGWYGHCIGHAKKGDTFATWLHGEEGRRAHYKWAGIPHALIKKWTAEHKRRAKTIRKLEEPTVEPSANACDATGGAGAARGAP